MWSNQTFREYLHFFGINKGDMKKYSCSVMNQNDLTVLKTFGRSVNQYVKSHYYIKCKNNTALNITNCKSPKVIDTALANSYTSLRFLEYFIDHDDPFSPGTLYIRSESLPVTGTLSTRMFYYITSVIYYS